MWRRIGALLFSVALCAGLILPVRASVLFSDVPETHWAYSQIERACNSGWVNGMGDGTYQPAQSVTNAQFVTIVTRAFYDKEVQYYKAQGLSGFAPNLAVAGALRLCENGMEGIAPEEWSLAVQRKPISRFDMAQVMANVMRREGWQVTEEEKNTVSEEIPDWHWIPANYQDAVALCYCWKLLNGLNDGTFGGETAMNRAQAAVVLTRLSDALAGRDDPGAENASREALCREIVRLTNLERVRAGLPELENCDMLSAAANVRAAELTVIFDHDRPDGTYFYTAVQSIRSGLNAGENFAANIASPAEVVREWMNSESHRNSILSPEFQSVGAGCYRDDSGKFYWVQLFMD